MAKIGLVGSVPTGKAILKGAADTMKKVSLELGGKNALIAYADADLKKLAAGIIKGMNFVLASLVGPLRGCSCMRASTIRFWTVVESFRASSAIPSIQARKWAA